jgi:preprotein translocase subunit YajC
MLLPFAFVFIGLFLVVAVFLIIRKQVTGKREMRNKDQNKR